LDSDDHHFHFGYHVHAAALITFVDRQLGLGDTFYNRVRGYVTTLIRDFANPSLADPYFPVFRSFDWFHGHSWAKGLFESGDGKDQESSSEDVFSTYALKLWAQQSFNPALEARANLMLAIQKRSLNAYFLLTSDNKNHPAQFIQNKVTGILFENKVDHVTYFGAESEKIQGIHMIPLTPISTYIRSPRFVAEEWDKYFKFNIGAVTDGWRGILMANRAIIDPREAWRFFTGELLGWTPNWIDGGASRSWYLTFAGGLGGN
jgi:endo-1,3(4)-beta-glucanase